jgi:hypothetical protein
MATYSAEQIIGKTLIAKRPIDLVRIASDNAPVVYTVDPGQTIGKVQSYLLPSNNRSSLYWQFIDQNNKAYYAAHAVGNFDVKSIADQGALTVVEQAAAAAEAEMSTGDKVFRLVKNLAFIGAGAYLLNTIINKKL